MSAPSYGCKCPQVAPCTWWRCGAWQTWQSRQGHSGRAAGDRHVLRLPRHRQSPSAGRLAYTSPTAAPLPRWPSTRLLWCVTARASGTSSTSSAAGTTLNSPSRVRKPEETRPRKVVCWILGAGGRYEAPLCHT